MTNKIMSNDDLAKFINNSSEAVKDESKPWDGENPTAKRVGVSAYNIALNRYEKMIIDAASAKEGATTSGFIRQAALRQAKNILGIN